AGAERGASAPAATRYGPTTNSAHVPAIASSDRSTATLCSQIREGMSHLLSRVRLRRPAASGLYRAASSNPRQSIVKMHSWQVHCGRLTTVQPIDKMRLRHERWRDDRAAPAATAVGEGAVAAG